MNIKLSNMYRNVKPIVRPVLTRVMFAILRYDVRFPLFSLCFDHSPMSCFGFVTKDVETSCDGVLERMCTGVVPILSGVKFDTTITNHSQSSLFLLFSYFFADRK